jgi:hypothetical protein
MKSGGGGILNDFDLAKRITEEDEVARHRDRTVSAFQVQISPMLIHAAGHLAIHFDIQPLETRKGPRRSGRYRVFRSRRAVPQSTIYGT